MALIRDYTVEHNTAYRGGCQVQSPTTGAIYYVCIEHAAVICRDWAKNEIGRDADPCYLGDPKVSACFAYPGSLVVTVNGFDAGTDNSRQQTFQFNVRD